METELSFSLQVFRGQKNAEIIVIRHNRVLIGSAAHCDIRLDDQGAAHEHVVLELEGENVIARALNYQIPALLNGSPLVGSTKIEQSTELQIIDTRIVISMVREVSKNQKRSPLRRALTAFSIAGALLFIPIAIYAIMNQGDDDPIGPPPPAAPLWEGGITTQCKFEAPDQATHYAAQMRALGDVNRERYPFDIKDGIGAVRSYEMATVCHRKAGHHDDAELDEELATEIRALVDADYFAHRIRLEHAIESDDARAAYLEVKILRKLTANLKGPFIDWLAYVERRIEFSMREVANPQDEDHL